MLQKKLNNTKNWQRNETLKHPWLTCFISVFSTNFKMLILLFFSGRIVCADYNANEESGQLEEEMVL